MEDIKPVNTKEMKRIIREIFGVTMDTKCEDSAISFSLISEDALEFLVKNEFMMIAFKNTDKAVDGCQFLIYGRHLTLKVELNTTKEQLLKNLQLLEKISKLLEEEREGD
jgi:hypothetical protein